MKVLRPLVEAAGADYRQWWALTRVMLKTDTRTTSFMGQRGSGDEDTQKKALRGMAIMYGMFGIFLAPFAWYIPDPFVGATLVYTMVLFLVGTTILIEFQSVVIDPSDHAILGFRPISSRTYFLVKLTNVFVYVSALATLLGLAGMIALVLRHGRWVGLASVLGLYGMTAFTAMALITTYALILHVVHPERLKRVLSYVQLGMSTLFYGFVILGNDLIDTSRVETLSVEPSLLTLLHPATWYASLAAVAGGQVGTYEVLGVLLGLGALLGLLALTTRHLSLSYAERLSELEASADGGAEAEAGSDEAVEIRTGGRGLGATLQRWMPAEMKAVARLILAQFRHDMKFRMAVLGILPLTVLYLVMSIQDGMLPDPFTGSVGATGDLMLLHFAVLVMPVMLMVNITFSDSSDAAWIFFTTPAQASKLVRHSKNVLILYFTVPYLVLVAALLAWFFDAWWHAAVHVVVLGLISNVALQFAVLWNPRLPFSQPLQKAQQGARVILLFMGVGVSLGILSIAMALAYRSAVGIVVTVVTLASINAFLEFAVSQKVGRRMQGLEFTG